MKAFLSTVPTHNCAPMAGDPGVDPGLRHPGNPDPRQLRWETPAHVRTSLQLLGLSPRSITALKRRGVTTAGALLADSENILANLGRVQAATIRLTLWRVGKQVK